MSATEAISIFEIFKIGVGPSSSHTIGPWVAALDFVELIKKTQADQMWVTLYGSLSKTGKGHATDKAIQLGLLGHRPQTIDSNKIDEYLSQLAQTQNFKAGTSDVVFRPKEHIIFSKDTKPEHPNTLIFEAYFQGQPSRSQTYYSIGGGFITKPNAEESETKIQFPFIIENGNDLIKAIEDTNLPISEIVLANEGIIHSRDVVSSKISAIFEAMKTCVYQGCITAGILPGGLQVSRRAKTICNKLLGNADFNNQQDWEDSIRSCNREFSSIMKWVSCFALATNEENAAMGRVVTSPTNGAAGVVPAVLLYFYFFCDGDDNKMIERFLCTAGQIAILFKNGATISAAVGGCQAEIGVSSSMAAAGLTEVLGGSPQQALMAAEIAMEHHLGLTCDPVGGLVQIPCIERNTMGATKAITAAYLALSGEPKDSKVNLDVVIKSMWDTAQEMNSKYKETSEGGLAFNIPVIIPEC